MVVGPGLWFVSVSVALVAFMYRCWGEGCSVINAGPRNEGWSSQTGYKRDASVAELYAVVSG